MLHQVAANYNVADNFAKAFQAPGRAIVGEAELFRISRQLGIDSLAGLGHPALGRVVRTARTSWVRRISIAPNDLFIKTYVYPSGRDRMRGLLRFTGPHRPSRARAEAHATAWLQAHGFASADVVGVVENRHLGVVHGAVLVLKAWQGQNLDTLLPALARADAVRIAAALGRFVRSLHLAGFRDRNLDLRNILARPGVTTDGDDWTFAKIDSPRHRIVRPDRADDRLARADWQRLLPQLQRFSLHEIAMSAGRADRRRIPT